MNSGTITLIPVANPKAYQKSLRYCDSNLNRRLFPKKNHETYEEQLGEVLCSFLERADVVLDLHSYQAQGGPFCFLGRSSEAEIAFCLSLDLAHYVYGWTEAFAPEGFEGLNQEQIEHYRKQAMGTTEYARIHGAIACTVECGQHQNKNNSDIGYECIIRAMGFSGLLATKDQIQKPVIESKFYKMKKAYFKDRPGTYVKNWRHLEGVSKGDLIARYHDGGEVIADIDGAIILPNPMAKHEKKEEWFYLASNQMAPGPATEGL